MSMIAALLAAASLGAMLFFSAIIAPSLFQALDEKQAGQFLRLTFPKYFAVNGVIALLAALAAFQPAASAMFLLCAAAMFGVRQFAIPVINEARDAAVAGDAEAKRKFDRWHRASVIVNVLEMALLAGAIYLLMSGL